MCKQFVDSHPHNAGVAAAAYWVLQQLTSVLCLGSRSALEDAADSSSDCDKCVAVAWAMQVRWSKGGGLSLCLLLLKAARRPGAHDAPAGWPRQCALRLPPCRRPLCHAQLSVGLVLPTLLVWSAQLNAAKEWAMRQQATTLQQQQRHGRARGPLTFDRAHPADKLAVVRHSQWGQVCDPVLQAAAACPGGWLVALPATAILGFVVAVVSIAHQPPLPGRSEL